MHDERQIIQMMLNRQCINPLEILIPDMEVLELYHDIMNNHMDELLQYAKASDLFGLMITFLNEASSLEITVLCKSKIESDFIKSLNIKLDNNYIVVDENMKTNIDGIYASGDIIKKKVYQIVTAASDGAIAALSIIKDLK